MEDILLRQVSMSAHGIPILGLKNGTAQVSILAVPLCKG